MAFHRHSSTLFSILLTNLMKIWLKRNKNIEIFNVLKTFESKQLMDFARFPLHFLGLLLLQY
jgi:hypothetical protein